ncbi:MAG: hypothetical protein J7603_09785 [Pseudacidovorax sp.]|nr:hypothetical protein [Pseudacidovorax sp.]
MFAIFVLSVKRIGGVGPAMQMERAAVAQVCNDWGVPFAAVRTISDRADDAAHADFGRFVARVASPFCAAIVRRALARL